MWEKIIKIYLLPLWYTNLFLRKIFQTFFEQLLEYILNIILHFMYCWLDGKPFQDLNFSSDVHTTLFYFISTSFETHYFRKVSLIFVDIWRFFFQYGQSCTVFWMSDPKFKSQLDSKFAVSCFSIIVSRDNNYIFKNSPNSFK